MRTFMTTLNEILNDKLLGDSKNLYFYSNGQNIGDYSLNDLYSESLTKAKIIDRFSRSKYVLIEGNNDFEFVSNFFAVLLAGKTAVPVTTSLWITPNYFTSIMDSILETTEADLFLCNDKTAHLMAYKKIRFISPLDWENMEIDSKDFVPKIVTPDDEALIQFSSGSTGNPKGVVLTHKNIIANLDQIASAIHLEDSDKNTVVSWLPVHHDMGLIGGLLYNLYKSNPIHLMTPYDFAVNPARWLKLITEVKANIIVGPNSGYHLTTKRVRDSKLNSYDLSSVRVALCGAEPINTKTLYSFVEKFSCCGFKESAFTPCYGMAESTLAISFFQQDSIRVESLCPDELHENKLAVPQYGDSEKEPLLAVSCGRPLKGMKVKIIDSKGNNLPERAVGEIIISGPSICQGYLNRPELNKKLFTGDYLKTGDMGFIANGEIFVTGRKKDVIIINGLNINAEEIEMQLLKNKSLRAGRLVAIPTKCKKNDSEDIALIIETKPRLYCLQEAYRENLADKVFKQINDYISVKKENIFIVPPGTIIKTTSGKVKRQKMRELLEDGTIESIKFSHAFFQYKLIENKTKANIMIGGITKSAEKRFTRIFNG